VLRPPSSADISLEINESTSSGSDVDTRYRESSLIWTIFQDTLAIASCADERTDITEGR